ncbi:MAG: hypothetical protein IE886_06740 [Campylobacterales bacterium]|nr:hypothetical protein [Campylobacterales bacterium]
MTTRPLPRIILAPGSLHECVELDASHDTADIGAAMAGGPFPLEIFYRRETETFEECVRHGQRRPLYLTTHDAAHIQALFDAY